MLPAPTEGVLPATIDEESRGALAALSCRVWAQLQGRTSADDPAEAVEAATTGGGGADEDLFRSERAAEVGRLDPILNDVAAKMRELLAQWPDHPALQLTQRLRAPTWLPMQLLADVAAGGGCRRREGAQQPSLRRLSSAHSLSRGGLHGRTC